MAVQLTHLLFRIPRERVEVKDGSYSIAAAASQMIVLHEHWLSSERQKTSSRRSDQRKGNLRLRVSSSEGCGWQAGLLDLIPLCSWRASEEIWVALNNEVLRADEDEHRNEKKRRAGTEDPRENPLTSGFVRHDSHLRESAVNRSDIEHCSPWWEASSLTTTTPWPHLGEECSIISKELLILTVLLAQILLAENVSTVGTRRWLLCILCNHSTSPFSVYDPELCCPTSVLVIAHFAEFGRGYLWLTRVQCSIGSRCASTQSSVSNVGCGVACDVTTGNIDVGGAEVPVTANSTAAAEKVLQLLGNTVRPISFYRGELGIVPDDSPHFTLIGSQDLVVKSRPDISTQPFRFLNSTFTHEKTLCLELELLSKARLLSPLHTGASAVCSLAVAPHLAVIGVARRFLASLLLAQRRAGKSAEALGVRVSVARIAPSLLDLGRAGLCHSKSRSSRGAMATLHAIPGPCVLMHRGDMYAALTLIVNNFYLKVQKRNFDLFRELRWHVPAKWRHQQATSECRSPISVRRLICRTAANPIRKLFRDLRLPIRHKTRSSSTNGYSLSSSNLHRRTKSTAKLRSHCGVNRTVIFCTHDCELLTVKWELGRSTFEKIAVRSACISTDTTTGMLPSKSRLIFLLYSIVSGKGDVHFPNEGLSSQMSAATKSYIVPLLVMV
ncbi:hypothetical protein PR048_026943 [Dryococelus australis]|uniref:Uncharacterized protein n=1 Tax=Dryococelus australis TaxID=614101 RepID=A0ABQ9GMR6_9NEOP|nr:hypothetical protein PR048_026943 [Dryococelus australis]